MRNLLALVGLVVIVVGGVGWYAGWYKFSLAKTSDGNLQINTTVDTQKASAETSDFLKNVGAVVSNHVDKAAQDAKSTAPATPPGGTPGPVAPVPAPMTPSPITAPPIAPDSTVPGTPFPPAPPAPPIAPGGIPLKAPK